MSLQVLTQKVGSTMSNNGVFPPLTAADLAPDESYLQPYKDAKPFLERVNAGTGAMPFTSSPDAQATYNPTRTIVTVHKTMNQTWGGKK